MGEEYPLTLTSMHNLTSVLVDQGKYDEAEEIHRRVIGLRRRRRGKTIFTL